eukprot:6507251-Pyramimonas_sp.AAC.1
MIDHLLEAGQAQDASVAEVASAFRRTERALAKRRRAIDDQDLGALEKFHESHTEEWVQGLIREAPALTEHASLFTAVPGPLPGVRTLEYGFHAACDGASDILSYGLNVARSTKNLMKSCNRVWQHLHRV